MRGGSGFAAFASAKFGLRAVAQSIARELGPKNIHVAHLVIDSSVDTEWVRQLIVSREGGNHPRQILILGGGERSDHDGVRSRATTQTEKPEERLGSTDVACEDHVDFYPNLLHRDARSLESSAEAVCPHPRPTNITHSLVSSLCLLESSVRSRVATRKRWSPGSAVRPRTKSTRITND